MAKSKKAKYQSAGALVVVAFIAFYAVSYHSFRQGHLASGFKELAAATFLTSVFFGLLIPTRCGITTTKGHPCRNRALWNIVRMRYWHSSKHEVLRALRHA
jgi:hypothetical protein